MITSYNSAAPPPPPPYDPPPRRRGTGVKVALVGAGIAVGAITATAIGANAVTSSGTGSTGTPAAAASSSSAASTPDRDHDGRGGGHAGEKAVSAANAATLRAAALKAVPGGTVERVETDSGDATYEVHMTKSDGSKVTVKFDKNLKVTGVESGMGK